MWRALESMWPLIVSAHAALITAGRPATALLAPLADIQAMLIMFSPLDVLTQLVSLRKSL
jgi:hypothetical protein